MPVEVSFDWDLIRMKLKTRKELLAEEIILLLLESGKISGKTQLQKEVFIASKEVLKNRAGDLLYHPDQFGPYSSLVAWATKRLQRMGMIAVSPRGEGHSTYSILESGIQYIDKVVREKGIPESLRSELKKRKANWDEWDRTGISIYVYRNYPEFRLEH